MTRDDLARFAGLEIDFESIGLMEPAVPQEPYFCTPVGAEYVGRLGCDGIHFILLPGEERIFCVDPSMGEIGTYVLPVAENLREFLSFVLYCRDANPISQIYWLSEERFQNLLKEDTEALWPGSEDFFARRDKALAAISQAFSLIPQDPYQAVKAMQSAFDSATLVFGPEYYDTLGL